ncbi:MAG: ATP-binding protein [Clostridia bacterium]|nr:ATP-binding protein [Clostridia bacterium]
MLNNITELISTNIIVTSILICIISILIVYLATGFITGPLKNMLKVIDKMSDSKFEEKIKVRGHDELAELGMAFNQMSAKLQKADANRQEFVSNVSHELKTPLSSMKVLIESLLLQDNVSEEMYKEFLGDTNSEIDRLTDIINHLLTIVKMDVKVLPLSLEAININDMINGIIKRLTPLASKKNLTLEFVEEKDEVMAEVDKINITLAISNLIENGIKYTDEGGVKVTLDQDHQNMYITITDTGIGLEEEEQTKIFDRFYRVDKTRDRQTGGTGLGLAITHRAIILHNGSIKVTSKVGEGTTFVVRIPLKQANKN